MIVVSFGGVPDPHPVSAAAAIVVRKVNIAARDRRPIAGWLDSSALCSAPQNGQRESLARTWRWHAEQGCRADTA